MFSRAEIRQNLLGCLEVALFMRAGISRFNADMSSLKKSFLIPLIVLPISIFTVIKAHPEGGLDITSMQILAFIYAARLFLSLAGFLGLVYMVARKLNKVEDFIRFATANNWLTLPVATLMLPLSLMFASGAYEFSEIYPLMVFLTLYSYAYTAFLAAHMLKLPMELACSLAIAGMAINQTSLAALKTITANALLLIS